MGHSDGAIEMESNYASFVFEHQMLVQGHYPISCSASSCTKNENQQEMKVKTGEADHIWDPIRDRINVPAVWTRHRTLVYVDLQRTFLAGRKVRRV